MHAKTALLAICLLILLFLLSACLLIGQTPTTPATAPLPSSAPLASNTHQPGVPLTATTSSLPTSAGSPTPTTTATLTPTASPSPTISLTPTITPSPTYDLPDVAVNTQAHCRYGPSIAYLHAADLYAGDHGVVWGRFAYSNYLQIKFDKLDYACWAAPSVIDVSGDISNIRYTAPDLLRIGSNMYGPPKNVSATRDGNQVTITWKRVNMTADDDRGYFIESWVCQNGAYLWWTVSFPDQTTTSYTVQDDAGCKQPSGGEIRTVEKHGYSEAVTIPWP
jgi:hypothetical protein